MSLSDPVIVALLNRLPAPGTAWPLADRLAWLRAVEAAFDVVYGNEPAAIVIRAGDLNVGDLKFSGELQSVNESSNAETKIEAAPKVDPPAARTVVTKNDTLQVRPDRSAPHPRGGAKRPEGIPTTFTMIQTVLKEKPKFTMIARDVMDAIEKRWWPGLGPTFLGPDISSAVTSGRLARNADGKLALTEKGESLISEDLRHKTRGEFQKPTNDAGMMVMKHETAVVVSPPVRAPAPEPKPAKPAPPKPRTPMAFKFEHNGRSTTLATAREFSIAGKLRVSMGKHVSEAFLAEAVIGSNTEAQRDTIRLACRGMNANLAEVGLKIEHYPGFGLIMKEVD